MRKGLNALSFLTNLLLSHACPPRKMYYADICIKRFKLAMILCSTHYPHHLNQHPHFEPPFLMPNFTYLPTPFLPASPHRRHHTQPYPKRKIPLNQYLENSRTLIPSPSPPTPKENPSTHLLLLPHPSTSSPLLTLGTAPSTPSINSCHGTARSTPSIGIAPPTGAPLWL